MGQPEPSQSLVARTCRAATVKPSPLGLGSCEVVLDVLRPVVGAVDDLGLRCGVVLLSSDAEWTAGSVG
jgi:hypothetical protein